MAKTALYFLALIPPEPLRAKLHDLKTEVAKSYNSKAALRSPPHITVHMPFRYSPRKESRLIKVLTEFCSKQEAFNLSLDGFGAFPLRVIFVSVKANVDLNSLQYQLGETMAKRFNVHNANYKERPFHPHITIGFRDLKKSNFIRAWEHFAVQKFKADFEATELTLLKHNGAIWEEHDSFKFGDILINPKPDRKC